MNHSKFEDFCGGTFWVSSLLLDNSWPEFTSCFINTVLVWIPCGYVWILLPYFLYTMKNEFSNSNLCPARYTTDRTDVKHPAADRTSVKHPASDKSRDVTSECEQLQSDGNGGKFTTVCVLKIVLTCLLALLSLVQLLLGARDHQPGAALMFSAVYAATYTVFPGYCSTYTLCPQMLIGFQLWYERRKGHIAMFIPFYFYIMNIILGIILLYTWVITMHYLSHLDNFSVAVATFSVNCVCFILTCVPDTPWGDRHGYQQMDWKFTPESEASYPSRLCFGWLLKLIYKAVRREITAEDVFQLNPRDQSQHLNLLFEQYWKNEVNRVIKINNSNLHKSTISSDTNNLIQNGKDVLMNVSHRPTQNGHNHSADNTNNESTTLLARKRSNIFGTWTQHSKPETKYPSLFLVLCRMEWKRIVTFIIIKAISDIFLICGPIILGVLMDRLQYSDEKTVWQLYFLSFVLMMLVILKSLHFSHAKYGSAVFALHVKTVMISAIFKKALSMSNSARQGYTVGEIVNLMSIDCQRMQENLTESAFLLTNPLLVLVILLLLYFYIGPAMVASICVVVITVPLNSWLISQQKGMQETVLKWKDQRIKIISEALNGMKVLKLYAWENKFKENVETIRANEIQELLKMAYIFAISEILMWMTPFLCSVATFSTYVLIDRNNVLDAKTTFVSLALLNILRIPIISFKLLVTYLVQITISMKRINKFLVTEDLDLSSPKFIPEAEYAISVKDGTFTWDTTLEPTLLNINTDIACGQLTAIVGSVGSGKSSLISAILGQMSKIHGQVTIKGTVAYVSQQAWIQNATVRDNILFGKEFNQHRYMQVIKACELERDLEILEAGDQTEIGERGINLSGGQKQRVSLARAVYSNSDIYLFDDPLSAVDAHVGKAIFKSIVGSKGILANKSRILVTHGIHWLSQVDRILVLNKGVISEQGSYNDLVTHNGPFAKYLEVYLTNYQSDESSTDEDEELVQSTTKKVSSCTTDTLTSKCDSSAKTDKGENCEDCVPYSNESYDKTVTGNTTELGGKLTVDENLKTGKVTADVFLTAGRFYGFCGLSIAFIFFVISKGSILWGNLFLADWTKDELLLNTTTRLTQEGDQRLTYYLVVYAVGFGLSQLLALAVFNFIFWHRMVRASSGLHQLLVDRLVRAPMSFFDQTPIGQILNRFTKDVDTIDITIPLCLNDILNIMSVAVLVFINIVAQTPIITPALFPICIIFYLLQKYHMRTARQLKRMESISRSPVYNHVSESFTGAVIIRTHGATERFQNEFEQKVDYNQMFFFANQITNSWLQLMVDIPASIVIFLATVVLIASGGDSSDIGLSGSYTVQLSIGLAFLVRQMSEIHTSVVAVERVQEYSKIDQEAMTINPDNRPSPSWPTKGDITFNEYQTCYRKGLALVLKKITCHINGGEKVGIIGRTGAGKSSFALSLFRIIEAVGGTITIDGMDIVDIGLHDLRNKLTILPQDSFIFSGSLRSNIDPFEQHTDDQLWAALERSHLKTFVSAQPERLGFECGQEGCNLSVGQRQLVCLARSLLRHTKILILDEATAAVDMQTDALIQKTIKEAFSDCTIIAIAHRLSTIMDYDRIIAMDDGVISEFDTPRNLINSKGVFYSMCKDAGLV